MKLHVTSLLIKLTKEGIAEHPYLANALKRVKYLVGFPLLVVVKARGKTLK